MKYLIYDLETDNKITRCGRKILNELLKSEVREFKVDDKVKLPLGETGTIISINNLIWGYKYTVCIRHATFNKTGQHEAFRAQDMVHEEFKFEFTNYIDTLTPDNNKLSAESYTQMKCIIETLREISKRENVVIITGTQPNE